MHTPVTADAMPNRMWVAVASGTQGAASAIRAAAGTCAEEGRREGNGGDAACRAMQNCSTGKRKKMRQQHAATA